MNIIINPSYKITRDLGLDQIRIAWVNALRASR